MNRNVEIEGKQFEFLSGYDKESVLKYIGTLHLYSANSSFIHRLARLTIQSLIHCSGKRCVDDNFGSIIQENYLYELSEDPQEYLFVDSVHDITKSYRVFPGMFGNLQYNLSRFFNIARKFQIDCAKIRYSRFYLHLSDCIAKKLNFNRYELGEPYNEKIYYPKMADNNIILSAITLSYAEILQIANDYNITSKEIDDLLYKHNEQKLREFDEYMSDYSIVETNPLYKLSDNNILVLQPSALLTAAHVNALDAIREILQEKFAKEYQDQLILDLKYSSPDVARDCFCMGDIEGSIALAFRIDRDKLLIPVIINTLNDIYSPVDSFSYISSVLKNIYQGQRIHILFCYNTIDAGLNIASVTQIKIFDFDDVVRVFALENFSLKDFWYYLEDRDKIDYIIQGQEIDLLAFYKENHRTFYTNRTVDALFPAIGNALPLRYESLSHLDEYVMTFRNKSARILPTPPKF